MSRISDVTTIDVRFPTSLSLDGSDAMNPDPDYSAAYVRIDTDAADGLAGHGFVFTIGRGNDVQVAAIRALADRLVGANVEELLGAMGATWRDLVHDSQLRWLGPEKGVMHMAIGAVVNALWDLKAKRAGQPLWRLLASMTPEELVELVDFRYLTDALTRDDALAILRAAEPGRAEREAELLRSGYPGYTTTPGWLGYDDAKLARLCGDTELMADVIAAFLQDCPTRLDAIARALDESHAEELRAETHALKGSAANLSATALFEAAQALERMAAVSPLPPIDAAWRLLSAEAAHLMKVLRDRTAKEPFSCAS